ncbi:MAG: membrane protein insertion efficiency factor YidD [Candidatus Magasanikbacteria bacterium RIFOXYD2_FULL_39_9]|uniref:Putative membrane protein insertion efficiency factor n=1 Tax=Candidatus Magasanikbacteria bacterium RIFOXYD1_FULL_40_23 TaxID=1798705 RepID=A0A1F6P8Q6_9BACT|nr:MAG: membrane protein insertion efficiency factor YidD [Candidatus Magasanikbacteria bacterium RIFOXYD2_FULL_39_9]OGH92546.1 MAG: membrane protein insertion efficiency factor YidD [Candidatus Magasanikbacteria bacterium RIFOXYD1_FULL_40_23]
MKIKKILDFLLFLPRTPLLFLIKIYQKTISPDHGLFKSQFPYGYCRFTPTCSEYGYEIIRKRGLVVGVALAAWRILRCNPWSKGGIDNP